MIVTESVMYWITTQDHGGIVMITQELINQGIQRISMIIYQMKKNKGEFLL